MFKGLRLLIIFIMMTFMSSAFAQWRPGTIIFDVPVSPDDIRTVIETIDYKETKDGDKKSYSLNIPIKQDDGSYAPVRVSYTETPTTRSVNIPGRGDVTVIKNEDGDYGLVLTPEQIKGASNISCTLTSSKNGKCTISPFVRIMGDKVLTADKLVVDYTEGQNLRIAQGQATNLRLTGKDNTTMTDAGDSAIGVSFNSQNKDMEIRLDTGRLTHTVTNPKNPSQTGTKFQVKDSGISTSLIVSNNNTRIQLNAETKAGIKYDSDPFSDKKIVIDTTSPVRASLNVVEDSGAQRADLVLSTQGVVNVTDTRANGKSSVLTATGETILKATQLSNDPNGPVGLEIGSDHLSLKSDGKKTSDIEVYGLRGTALADKGLIGSANLQADLIKHTETKPGKNPIFTEIQSAEVFFEENDVFKKYEILAGRAYYNNGKQEIIAEDLKGGEIKYKDPATAETFNGQAIKKESIFMGDGARISDKDGIAELNGGMVIRQVEVQNKDKYVLVNGTNGSVKSDKYDVKLQDGFQIVSHTRADKTSTTRIVAADVAAQDKGKTYQILESDTTYEVLGKTAKGKDVISLSHTSKGISSNLTNIDQLSVTAVSADTIKYGEVSFNSLTHKDPEKNQEFRILGAKTVFYTDTTLPDNKIREGQLEASKLGAKAKNDVFEIVAKDANGVEGKFKIYLYENGESKFYKIYAEDGKEVHLSGIDRNNRHANVLLSAVEYLETPEFRQIYGRNLSGKLQTVDGQSEKLQAFSIESLAAFEKADGSLKQYALTNGSFSEVSSKGTTSVTGVNAGVERTPTATYGAATFQNLSYKGSDKKQEVKILGAQVLYLSDSSNPSQKKQQGEASFDRVGIQQENQIIDIVAKDAQGKEGKFKIHFSQDGDQKSYRIFAEDGKQVFFETTDKNNRHAQVVLEAIDYLETPEFRQVQARNLSGKLQSADQKTIQQFSLGTVGAIQTGKNSQGAILNGSISQTEQGKSQSGLTFETLQFSQSNHLDEKTLKGEMLGGVIRYVELKGDKKTKEAEITLGSVLVNQEKKGTEALTVVNVNNIDLVAVDHEALMKVTGKIGSANYLNTSAIQVLEVNNIKDLKIEDLAKGHSGVLNGEQIVRVVQRDANGKETGSYLLMKSTVLTASETENNINANIRIGVLELLRDKASGQNIILNADVDGRIRLEKGKSPIGGEVNFGLKGKNLTTQSQSYVSADGNTVGKYFAIKPVDAEGRLDKLHLSAGPDFLKDAISLEAKGGQGGGKSLSFTFQQDKANGTYYVRAEFKEGDKVKVKLFPFTLESKNENGDAVAELMLTPKGQNFYNHLEIISSVVDAHEITDWLSVSDGGMIVARTGTLGGFGFEMMYQNKKYFNPGDIMQNQIGMDKAATYGVGLFHENKNGDRLSGGLMLSGDSEFQYQTNGRGVLKIFGQDMNTQGNIPATINLYMKKEWADGDSLYGGIFVDTASLAVDRDKLRRDATFYENGRSYGGAGASVAYSKKLSENSRLTVAAGVNNNFQDPALCVTYTVLMGAPSRLSRDTLNITNRLVQEQRYDPPPFRDPTPNGPTMQGAISQLRYEVDKLAAEKQEAVALEKVKDALYDGEKNPRALTRISDKDLELLKSLEKKKGGNTSATLENLIYAARAPSSTLDAAEIRATLDRLNSRYQDTDSVEIHELYLEKYRQLLDLTSR